MSAPYRSASPVPEEPDSVCISREEYAHLRRATEIIEEVERRCEDVTLRSYSRRRPWEVTFDDAGGWLEGVGITFQEAVEDALDLAPVTPWYPETPRRIPWVRLLLFGAVLGQAVLWGFQYL